MKQNLAKFIQSEWERARDFRCDPQTLMSDAERAFVERANAQMIPVHRPSWPDFIIDQAGQLIAVEVKGRTDKTSPNQIRTFNLLTRMGVRIFVWSPEHPHKLQPWRGKRITGRKKR